jgi:hypothetical protein
LNQRQIDPETEELEASPEDEKRKWFYYTAKGMNVVEAQSWQIKQLKAMKLLIDAITED